MNIKSILLIAIYLTAIEASAQHDGTTGDMRTFAEQTQVVLSRNPFDQKNNTVGTQYLFPHWVHGNLITNDGQAFPDYLYNFDKITQGLYRLQPDSAIFLIDKAQIKSLSLTDGVNTFDFESLPSLHTGSLYRNLVKGPKYSLYSLTKTKFIASNYTTNGISSSGNLYDEFKDAITYYIVMSDGTAKEINFKKKAINSMFAADKTKVDQFFKDHSSEDVDENFLKLLVTSLNT